MSVNKQKLEKLKQLSPLAAAIAFSASIPAQIQAEAFVVDVDILEGSTSQQQLDDAISVIEGEGYDSHTITFASGVSGTLYLNGFDLYEGGSLTIDGSATTGLELILEGESSVYANNGSLTINNVGLTLEGESSIAMQSYSDLSMNNVDLTLVDESNISAYTDSYLEMNDLTINIERAYFYNDVNSFSLGNSNLNMSNVTIDVNSVNSFGFDVIRVTNYSNVSLDDVHVDLAGEAEGMSVRNSNVTISNSSFTGMSDYQGIHIYADEGESSATITNSRFEGNYSDNLLTFNTSYSGSLDITLDGLTFNENDANSTILNVQTQTRHPKYSSTNQTINLTLTNSTFSNNEGEGAVVNLENNNFYTPGTGSNSLTALLGNVTFANNETWQGVISAQADYIYSGNTDLNLAMAHVTVANNSSSISSYNAGLSVDNNTGEGEGGNSINVDIINSIISGNQGSNNDNQSNIYTNIDINIDNSLFGYSTDGEGNILGDNFGSGVIIGSNNIIGEDPLLGELADNGGSTLTMLPQADSPVIDAGDSDFAAKLEVDLELLFDQREEDRVRGAAPDMGAVEVIPADEEPTVRKKDKKSFFGSVGFGSVLMTLGLLGLRRKRK